MRRFTLLVMFISLSVIGSLIKIPFTIGSIALDSAPAVVAAVFLSQQLLRLWQVLDMLYLLYLADFRLVHFIYLWLLKWPLFYTLSVC